MHTQGPFSRGSLYLFFYLAAAVTELRKIGVSKLAIYSANANANAK